MFEKKKGLGDIISEKIAGAFDWLKKEHLMDVLKEYGQEYLLSKLSSTVIDTIKEEISDLKRQLVRVTMLIVFLCAGAILFMVGIAQYIAFVMPALSHGLVYIILGILLLFVALLLYVKK